jgi:hypothetical protein
MQRALLASLLLVISAGPVSAQQALRPAPCGRATTEVSLAMPGNAATAGQPRVIRVDYGQPHLRGRSLHTDSLVPYGTPWRTGANDPTTLTTDVDLILGGQTVPRGSYVLWTLPGASGWRLFVQRRAAPGAEQSPMQADAADVVARIDLRVQSTAAPLESLSMWLIPSLSPDAARGELRIGWATTLLSTDWVVRP